MAISKRLKAERKEIWKLLFAIDSCNYVIDTLDFLEKNYDDLTERTVYTIVAGMCTVYSRLFVKNVKVGRLSKKKYVPSEYLDVHNKILRHRNTQFAHVDPTEPRK